MTMYHRFTLGDLISALEKLGDAPVKGLTGEVYSYRGYYERNATEPTNEVYPATTLANSYRSQIGNVMQGWKGGYYPVRQDQLVYYVGEGDTGPVIIGIECGEDNVHHPVLLADDYHF